jgi:VirK protein
MMRAMFRSPLLFSLPCVALALVLGGCAPIAPHRLVSSGQLMKALEEGRQVRAVIFYSRCKMMVDGKGQPSPDTTGGITLQAFEHFGSGVTGNELAYTAVTTTRLLVHSHYGTVYDYVRLKVGFDGEVEVAARYLKPPTLEVVLEETFHCRVDDGVRLFAD